MRLVFCGSGEVAAPSLAALHAAGHDIAAVYTQPPRKAGRGGKLRRTPIAELAAELGLPAVEAENINRDGHPEAIAGSGAAMVAVVDFGQIISRKVRQATPLGSVCMHVSLLPELRGAAPINWAIIRGLKRTGVTTFQVVREIDAGPIYLQESLDIGPEETAEELRGRLSALGGSLLIRTVEGLAAGAMEAREQDHFLATMAPKLEKTDGRLDFTQGAAAIANRIRGTWPWPGVHADFIHAGGKPVRVILARARAHPGSSVTEPGTLSTQLHINTHDGAIEVLELQVAGKRLMGWRDFVNGYRAAAGDRFVPAAD